MKPLGPPHPAAMARGNGQKPSQGSPGRQWPGDGRHLGGQCLTPAPVVQQLLQKEGRRGAQAGPHEAVRSSRPLWPTHHRSPQDPNSRRAPAPRRGEVGEGQPRPCPCTTQRGPRPDGTQAGPHRGGRPCSNRARVGWTCLLLRSPRRDTNCFFPNREY